ncbi:MAG TPA: hypothetical protein VKU41_23495 [Polyangiaceae bacterium]|nr:hypothetical protein [Polyangiaceae bacterium]
MSIPWESAFIAIGTALGEPLDALVDAVGPEGAARAGELVSGLREQTREGRARALARALSAIAAGIDGAGIA